MITLLLFIYLFCFYISFIFYVVISTFLVYYIYIFLLIGFFCKIVISYIYYFKLLFLSKLGLKYLLFFVYGCAFFVFGPLFTLSFLFVATLITPIIIYKKYFHIYAQKTRQYYIHIFKLYILKNSYLLAFKSKIFLIITTIHTFFLLITSPFVEVASFLLIIPLFFLNFLFYLHDWLDFVSDYALDWQYITDFYIGWYINAVFEKICDFYEPALDIFLDSWFYPFILIFESALFFFYYLNLIGSGFSLAILCCSFFYFLVSLLLLPFEYLLSYALSELLYQKKSKTYSEIIYDKIRFFIIEFYQDLKFYGFLQYSFYEKYFLKYVYAYYSMKDSKYEMTSVLEAKVMLFNFSLCYFSFCVGIISVLFLFHYFHFTNWVGVFFCTFFQIYIVYKIYKFFCFVNSYKTFIFYIHNFVKYYIRIKNFIFYWTFNFNSKVLYIDFLLLLKNSINYIFYLFDISKDLSKFNIFNFLIQIFILPFFKIFFILFFKLREKYILIILFILELIRFQRVEKSNKYFRGIFNALTVFKYWDRYYGRFANIAQKHNFNLYFNYIYREKIQKKMFFEGWELKNDFIFNIIQIFCRSRRYRFPFVMKYLQTKIVFLDLKIYKSNQIKKQLLQFKNIPEYLNYLKTQESTIKYLIPKKILLINDLYKRLQTIIQIQSYYFLLFYFYKLENILNEIIYIKKKNQSYGLEKFLFSIYKQIKKINILEVINDFLKGGYRYKIRLKKSKIMPENDFYTAMNLIVDNSDRHKNQYHLKLQILCLLQTTMLYPEINPEVIPYFLINFAKEFNQKKLFKNSLFFYLNTISKNNKNNFFLMPNIENDLDDLFKFFNNNNNFIFLILNNFTSYYSFDFKNVKNTYFYTIIKFERYQSILFFIFLIPTLKILLYKKSINIYKILNLKPINLIVIRNTDYFLIYEFYKFYINIINKILYNRYTISNTNKKDICKIKINQNFFNLKFNKRQYFGIIPIITPLNIKINFFYYNKNFDNISLSFLKLYEDSLKEKIFLENSNLNNFKKNLFFIFLNQKLTAFKNNILELYMCSKKKIINYFLLIKINRFFLNFLIIFILISTIYFLIFLSIKFYYFLKIILFIIKFKLKAPFIYTILINPEISFKFLLVNIDLFCDISGDMAFERDNYKPLYQELKENQNFEQLNDFVEVNNEEYNNSFLCGKSQQKKINFLKKIYIKLFFFL